MDHDLLVALRCGGGTVLCFVAGKGLCLHTEHDGFELTRRQACALTAGVGGQREGQRAPSEDGDIDPLPVAEAAHAEALDVLFPFRAVLVVVTGKGIALVLLGGADRQLILAVSVIGFDRAVHGAEALKLHVLRQGLGCRGIQGNAGDAHGLLQRVGHGPGIRQADQGLVLGCGQLVSGIEVFRLLVRNKLGHGVCRHVMVSVPAVGMRLGPVDHLLTVHVGEIGVIADIAVKINVLCRGIADHPVTEQEGHIGVPDVAGIFVQRLADVGVLLGLGRVHIQQVIGQQLGAQGGNLLCRKRLRGCGFSSCGLNRCGHNGCGLNGCGCFRYGRGRGGLDLILAAHEVHVGLPDLIGILIQCLTDVGIRLCIGGIDAQQIIGKKLRAYGLELVRGSGLQNGGLLDHRLRDGGLLDHRLRNNGLLDHGLRDGGLLDHRLCSGGLWGRFLNEKGHIGVPDRVGLIIEGRAYVRIPLGIGGIPVQHIVGQKRGAHILDLRRSVGHGLDGFGFRRGRFGLCSHPLAAEGIGIVLPEFFRRAEHLLLLGLGLCLVCGHHARHVVKQHLLA